MESLQHTNQIMSRVNFKFRMFTTIITDCKGENEAGRQITRYHALGLGPAHVIGVNSGLGVDATIEAAGDLIDALDASLGAKGTIVVNVAPRGVKTDGSNGNYFCYFYYRETLVISSTKGYCLSLLKTFDIVKSVNILPTEKVLHYAKKNSLIDATLEKHILKTQFRSFESVPRVARWLHDGVQLPYELYAIDQIPDIPDCIWCIDAFGNAKTTIFLNEREKRRMLNTFQHDILNTNLGKFSFYNRLKDVPDGETAFYIGSSGLGNKRFLELATQNREGSALKSLHVKVGDTITF